jgi:hypothetical protein
VIHNCSGGGIARAALLIAQAIVVFERLRRLCGEGEDATLNSYQPRDGTLTSNDNFYLVVFRALGMW